MPRSDLNFTRPRRYLSFAELRLKRERNRAIVWGVIVSLTIHFIVLNLIIWTKNDQLAGHPSVFAEGGIAAGSEELQPLRLTLVSPAPQHATVATQPVAPAENHDPEKDDDDQKPALEFKDGTAISQDGATSDPTEEPMHTISALVDGPILEQASNPANGTVEGSKNLIGQIARCLPSGVRPKLTNTRLNLQLDEKGQLTLVPQLDIDLDRSTPTQITDANLIVQAALQCSPYILPQKTPLTISLLADFTGGLPAH